MINNEGQIKLNSILFGAYCHTKNKPFHISHNSSHFRIKTATMTAKISYFDICKLTACTVQCTVPLISIYSIVLYTLP